MFGYIIPNRTELTKEEKSRYNAVYCGLCKILGEKYGRIGRASLTYDMTFLAMLLSSLYNMDEEKGKEKCPVHPIKAHSYAWSPATEYAADMNIILSYYQAMDDWNDDRNHAAHEKAKLLEKHLDAIKHCWPRTCEVMEETLARLGKMERENELNPDRPTNCFGELMGELFVYREDNHTQALRRMGAALGRYVYLLDACNDLKADIKKRRYNPLVAQLDTNFKPILTMMMGECTDEFEKLPIQRDLHILQNVLYSGVWTRYRPKKEE